MTRAGIHYRITPERICVLTFDRPNSSANIFDKETLEELSVRLDELEKERDLAGLVLTSAKSSIFNAGADLQLLASPIPEEEIAAFIRLGQRQMNRLAALPLKKVAAIHGACMGGGLEICLACDYRIGSKAAVTRLSLPETSVGLLSAWGGLTRLPRLIGVEPALDLVLTGKALNPEQALQHGILDEIVEPEKLEEVACQKLAAGQVTRGGKQAPNPDAESLLQIGRSRRERVLTETKGGNPALLKAVEVVIAGVADSIEHSMARELAAFMEVVKTEPTQNLLRFFFLKENARKAARSVVGSPVMNKIGVIGVGTMGAGIAYWASTRGISVILQDVSVEATEHGLTRISELYQKGVKRGLFTSAQAQEGLRRISVATNPEALAPAELVIEAVAEDVEIKKSVLRRAGEIVPASTLLATNTSALPVSEIASAVTSPERVLGLHFFNPVPRMPLVEVIGGRQTAPEAAERAKRFVQQLGKWPLQLPDTPGFLVNRVLFPYLLEAVRLQMSGYPGSDIDQAMLDFGMAMAPLRVIDEVGLDIALAISNALHRGLGDRYAPPDLLVSLHAAGNLGRKRGSGFYSYAKPRETSDRAAARSKTGVTSSRADELQDSMVLLMVNEAARCLEERIVSTASDLDFAMVIGAGFPAFRGGPLRYADWMGLPKVVAAMEKLANEKGSCFAPCSLLRKLGGDGGSFYRPMSQALTERMSR
jgi:3-hydroxyacyl-CoA dehydrogenase/enoyl-CoA hydratase/3-hydroxybutyryl-CoA epimerase